MISAKDIRKSFLDYFAKYDHKILPSSPLVPKEDPSLLFTNAGMVPFKKVFLGQEKRNYNRAATAQKCLRVGGKHNDLENVGRTARHHTFFEMLGNFSFGDYFKEEAIVFAWDYLTKELELPVERLYVTVYKDDDEAEELWKKVSGLPKERIYRLGEDENFWSMGETGPCGPCSEILIDQGESMACGPNCEIGVCDCDRYLEIWNLVFMQYNRDDHGEMTPLPKPSIDTGMGLERIAAVCQGVYSNFDTDLFSALIQRLSNQVGVDYGTNEDSDTAFRVIADHSRSIPFMIADGILPANEGRGYVLRRLIRRAYRFGNFLGLDEPFLYQACKQLVKEMGEAYPELVKAEDFISKVVFQEEENFNKTLDKGLSLLDEELRQLKLQNQKVVPGQVAFKLYDTFGFPVDIVKDLAEKQDLQVDEQGFNQLMQEQKQRSKAAWAGSGEIDLANEFASYLESGWSTEFLGYETLQTSSRVVALRDNQGESLEEADSQGDEIYLVTEKTPFYGESGGQVGDQGKIISETGEAEVVNTLKPGPNFIVQVAKIEKGNFRLGQEVFLEVDQESRLATARNHTCTHLLHAALRKVLGEHVKQSGSLVSKDRLRFDFTHINPLTPEEIKQVEDEVNHFILSDRPVWSKEVYFDQAVQEGAMGLFEEKYEDVVRLVEVPGISKELCGGTHLESIGQAGSFYILSETGISSGIRRIEASTGWNSLQQYRRQRKTLQELSSILKVQPEQLVDRVKELQEQLKTALKEKEDLETKQAYSGRQNLWDQLEEIKGVKVLAVQVDLPPSAGMKGLRNMVDELRTQMDSGAILLGSKNNDKALLILYVSKDLQDRFSAPELIKEVAVEVQGSGGGRPDLAQAGGNDPEGIDRSIKRFKELIASKL